jgi:hypothetical protein
MKEKGILFSTEMVRAILDGRKTQTRRIVKPQPDPESKIEYMPVAPSLDWEQHYNETWKPWHWETSEGESISKFCPYGSVGDFLFVRETHYRFGYWVKNGVTKKGQQKWRFVVMPDDVRYVDNPPNDINHPIRTSRDKLTPGQATWYKRSSLFMPKTAARIWLKVTKVRAERLQDISEQDAIVEGIEPHPFHTHVFKEYGFVRKGDERFFTNAIDSYKSLWKSINGAESWDANHRVWVISFEVISKTGKP